MSEQSQSAKDESYSLRHTLPDRFYKSPCPFGVGKTYLLTRFISDNYVFSYGYLPLLSSCIRLCAVFVMGAVPNLIITQLPPFDNRAFYTIFSLYSDISHKYIS